MSISYRSRKAGLIFFAWILVLLPALVYPCESCKGNPDSPMTAGMNVAIFAMLVITQGVLGWFIWFFLQIRKRMRASAPAGLTEGQSDAV